MHNTDEESTGASATLGVDPEISRSQDSRSMLAILSGKGTRCGSRVEGGGRETAVRYEGMDLDLKGGTTWKEGVEGSEVG